MLSKEDTKKICTISKKYNVKRVLLFGSSIDPNSEAKDIDLAVEGINGRDFFSYYSELYFGLSKPVDLVDLKNKNKFADLVRIEGLVIYG